jgi:ABC-type multidrug transport system fused ATPase/permease subunit
LSTRNGRSPARVVLPILIISALVAISFIAAIVLFVTANSTLGVVSLSVSVIGFIAMSLMMRAEINHESQQQDLLDAPNLETWADFVDAHDDFLFSPERAS